jgi:hypothetical protein
MHVTALIAAIGAIGVAVMAHFVLRSQGVPGSPTEADSPEAPESVEAGEVREAGEVAEPAGPPEEVPQVAPTRLGATDA